MQHSDTDANPRRLVQVSDVDRDHFLVVEVLSALAFVVQLGKGEIDYLTIGAVVAIVAVVAVIILNKTKRSQSTELAVSF